MLKPVLKPEIKQKWLNALRSGQYQQTSRTLRNGDCYCCLGVLCDVSALGSWGQDQFNDYTYEYNDEQRDSYPPDTVILSVANLKTQDIFPKQLPDSQGFLEKVFALGNGSISIEDLKERTVFECLAFTNDKGASFEAIAQVIERYL